MWTVRVQRAIAISVLEMLLVQGIPVTSMLD